MHRRKSSKEDAPNVTLSLTPVSGSPTAVEYSPEDTNDPPERTRPRAQASPASSSPVRMSMMPTPRSVPIPGLRPTSPLRPAFDSPPSPSEKYGSPTALDHARRHSRIHSRNLSVFFPRPGQAGMLSEVPIAEDGVQEIEAPVSLMPPVSTPPQKRMTAGFQFGARPPSNGVPGLSDTPSSDGTPPRTSVRRGHHHKHSMSHNFFSFLEPGSTHVPRSPASATFSPQTPQTPWQPISPFPASASMSTFPSTDSDTLLPSASSSTIASGPIASAQLRDQSFVQRVWLLPWSLKQALLFAVVQFCVGASLWVTGQQKASLSSTGLGYWVVFDAAGVYMRVAGSLSKYGDQRSLRNPFGSLRVETVALFAQSIYLLFAAVYVCKETVEHIILSTGESHHHHRGDEDELYGLVFPDLLVIISLALIIFSNFMYNNHSRLVDAIGYQFPTLYTLIKPDSSTDPLHSSPLARFLANPFTLAPVAFSLSLLFASSLLDPPQHRAADLLLAAVETVFTFVIAYPAAVSLGKVLLQTAPERGLPAGQMEAFSRALKEIEHHPSVLHVPAPHVWQLTPPPSDPTEKGALVATVELHVKKGVGDDEVLEITKWAWERCTATLGGEVTIGILRE